jgi:hypothetical protein
MVRENLSGKKQHLTVRMIRAEIARKLEKFNPVDLEEMNIVRLMNRRDVKFIFSVNKLPGLLKQAANKYHVLQIDHQRDFLYRTTYMDSPEFMFFYQHVRGKLPRFKVRYRLYEYSGQSFLEVKCKTNKNNTTKDRIKSNLQENYFNSQGIRFIKDHISVDAVNLKPVLTTSFVRLTLVGLKTMERITIDYNLTFSNNKGKVIELPLLAIAELKTQRFNNQSAFNKLVKEFNIRQTGFSKYCIGISLLYNPNKQNKLKNKFLLINKIESGS